MARRKAHKRGKRFSAWRMLKGVAYVGAIAAPAYQLYKNAGGDVAETRGAALTTVLQSACFTDTSGTIRLDRGAMIWGPVAVLGVADFLTSKMGLQRPIQRGINNLLG